MDSVLVDFDRPVLSEGRVPDPDSVDEVYVDRTYATDEGLQVGDTVSFTVFPPEVLGAGVRLVRRQGSSTRRWPR